MYKKLFIAFWFFGFITAYSQNFSSDVIAVSGEHNSNEEYQLTWIIGESMTEIFSDSSSVLNQGFLQTYLVITSIETPQIMGLEMNIYPNPTNDFITIDYSNTSVQKIKYTVTDINGKNYFTGILKPDEKIQQIELSNLAPGIYFLSILSKETTQLFKIIKK